MRIKKMKWTGQKLVVIFVLVILAAAGVYAIVSRSPAPASEQAARLAPWRNSGVPNPAPRRTDPISAELVFLEKNGYSTKYSMRDFTNQRFAERTDVSGIFIYASNFYQEAGPDTRIFPDTMTGTTFINCNLDNVYIPPGNKVEGGTRRRIKNINGRDWLVDKNNKPIHPL